MRSHHESGRSRKTLKTLTKTSHSIFSPPRQSGTGTRKSLEILGKTTIWRARQGNINIPLNLTTYGLDAQEEPILVPQKCGNVWKSITKTSFPGNMVDCVHPVSGGGNYKKARKPLVKQAFGQHGGFHDRHCRGGENIKKLENPW